MKFVISIFGIIFLCVNCGVVLNGYDMVEYFCLGRMEEGVLGDQLHWCNLTTYDFSDYKIRRIEEPWTFYFSNEINMKKFSENPWKYAPKFGGFCTWGLGNEFGPYWPWQKDFLGPPAQPWDTWEVYNGSLMFNFFPEIEERFFQDPLGNFESAIDRWVGFWGALQAGPFNTECDTADCFGNPQIGPKTPLIFTEVEKVSEPQVICALGSD